MPVIGNMDLCAAIKPLQDCYHTPPLTSFGSLLYTALRLGQIMGSTNSPGWDSISCQKHIVCSDKKKSSWAPHDRGYEMRISSPAISLVRSRSLTLTFCHESPQSIEFRIKLLFQCPLKARLSIKLTITPIIRGSD